MRITRVLIKSFRSIQSVDFEPRSLTAICGPNSCGKSNILRALKFAFVQKFEAERMADNICQRVASPNAACQVKLWFDAPSPALVASAGLKGGQPFMYSVSVKRNGTLTSTLNGDKLDIEARDRFRAGVLVVHVPPIRDVAAEGLKPFRETLEEVLRRTRGPDSFAQRSEQMQDLVRTRGKALLDKTKNLARDLLGVDALVVDAHGVDLQHLLAGVGVRATVGGKEQGLDKLGTGHQSSVILNLYRQLGEESKRFVLYLFEEPDNHLHPTSLRGIAEDLTQCAGEEDAQVFLTTHSPYLLNQFDHRLVLPLTTDGNRITQKRPKNVKRSDREVRIAFGRYGLKPAEALLAHRVVVVEGPNDVTILRTLVELETGVSPDRQDILIVPAGGKDGVSDLTAFLHDFGVDWRAFFDHDAASNTSSPLLKSGLSSAQKDEIAAAAKTIRAHLQPLLTKDGRAKKIMNAILSELGKTPPGGAQFAGSTIDAFIRKLGLLTQTEQNALAIAVRSQQPKKIRKLLSPKRTWLWTGCIEEVVLQVKGAAQDAEALLRTKGVLTKAFANDGERYQRLVSILHNSAHEPDLVRDVIEALWLAKRFDKSEVKAATRFLLS